MRCFVYLATRKEAKALLCDPNKEPLFSKRVKAFSKLRMKILNRIENYLYYIERVPGYTHQLDFESVREVSGKDILAKII